MSRSKAFFLGAAGALALFFHSACSLKEGACLRMSDCDDGLSCVEGTCMGASSSSATSVAGDASSSPADASAE